MADVRARLLQAGIEVLRERGPDASVAEIARRAGVSDGSFFSSFASKQDLVRVLVAARMKVTLEIARKHNRATGPAIERLEAFIWEAAADIAPHRAYLQVAERLGALDESHLRTLEDLDATVTRLARTAQREGALRENVTATDVVGIVMLSTAAAVPYLHSEPLRWHRYVTFFIDGLRNPKRPLPGHGAAPAELLEEAAAVRRPAQLRPSR